jgi:hypothetical protein
MGTVARGAGGQEPPASPEERIDPFAHVGCGGRLLPARTLRYEGTR